MTDASTPMTVLGLLIEPADEAAVLTAIAVGAPGGISGLIGGGMIQAVEIEGGSVLWLDEEGKHKRLATNLLATKIAHRLHAGLYPDDTINGRALVLGETTGLGGELMSADLTAGTLAALRAVGVDVVE